MFGKPLKIERLRKRIGKTVSLIYRIFCMLVLTPTTKLKIKIFLKNKNVWEILYSIAVFIREIIVRILVFEWCFWHHYFELDISNLIVRCMKTWFSKNLIKYFSTCIIRSGDLGKDSKKGKAEQNQDYDTNKSI